MGGKLKPASQDEQEKYDNEMANINGEGEQEAAEQEEGGELDYYRR